MPDLFLFFGSIIATFYNDHAPQRFHTKYGSDQAMIRADDCPVMDGFLTIANH